MVNIERFQTETLKKMFHCNYGHFREKKNSINFFINDLSIL